MDLVILSVWWSLIVSSLRLHASRHGVILYYPPRLLLASPQKHQGKSGLTTNTNAHANAHISTHANAQLKAHANAHANGPRLKWNPRATKAAVKPVKFIFGGQRGANTSINANSNANINANNGINANNANNGITDANADAKVSFTSGKKERPGIRYEVTPPSSGVLRKRTSSLRQEKQEEKEKEEEEEEEEEKNGEDAEKDEFKIDTRTNSGPRFSFNNVLCGYSMRRWEEMK